MQLNTFGELRSPKQRRGRPEHVYTVPSPEVICDVLGVRGPTWSSPLQHRSSREARMALYAAKIAYKPGRYSNAALCRWFGVSRNTLKSYERELNIVRRAQYEEAPLAGWNLDLLPRPQMGVWLQTPAGRRYPTDAAIAQNLLLRGRVSLVRQKPNFIGTAAYLAQQRERAIARIRATDAHKTAASSSTKSIKQPAPNTRPLIDAPPKNDLPLPAFKPIPRHAEEDELNLILRPPRRAIPPETALPEPAPDPQTALRTLKRQWRLIGGCSSMTMRWERLRLVEAVLPGAKGLMGDRQFAMLESDSPRRLLAWLRPKIGQPLYTRADITRLCTLMSDELTRKNARQLMQTYGTAKVLRCAEWVATRSGLHNPAGYLITCLRADAVAQKWGLR